MIDINSIDLDALEGASEGEVFTNPREEWLKAKWGKFSASENHRLIAKGNVVSDFDIIGERGEYYVTNFSKVISKEPFRLKSDAKKWLSGFRKIYNEENGKDILNDGGISYAKEKAIQEMTVFCGDDGYKSDAMNRGSETEEEAVSKFEEASGINLVKTGVDQEFVLSDCNEHGVTPDGISPDYDFGVEVKCPNSLTHQQYLHIYNTSSLKALAPKYYWQCQSAMLILEFDYYCFISYDPRYHVHDLRLHVVIIERNESDIEYLKHRIGIAIEFKKNFIEKTLSIPRNSHESIIYLRRKKMEQVSP